MTTSSKVTYQGFKIWNDGETYQWRNGHCDGFDTLAECKEDINAWNAETQQHNANFDTPEDTPCLELPWWITER